MTVDRFSKAVKGSSASSFLEIRALLDKRTTEAQTFIAEIRNELSESHLNSIQRGIADILSKADDISRIAIFVDEQEREGVLTWISATQMDTVHVTQRDKAEADDRQNPGSWILGNTKYLQWENAEETSSLWLCSGVGTGKTVLTSTVVEDRRRNNSGPMAYFYCSGAPGIEAGGMTAENILKCILRQFAEGSEVAFSLVASKWKELKSHGLRALTRMEVLNLISTIIKDEQTLVATIIVDGLDELTTDALRILLDAIATLKGLNYGILKIFASSRWNQRIEDYFVDAFLISNIASETSDDMEIYIDSAVQAQARGRQNIDFGLVDDIRRTLLKRAEGM